jgi:MoaA/NifB/PqqE/SkfB family radical SAM enzyme
LKYSELLAKAGLNNQLLTVLMELTYRCNLACEFCYNDLSQSGRLLKLEDYTRVIDELAELGVLNITLSGGEPMLHPNFFAIGAHARKKRFGVTIKTNAIPLTQRNIDRLIAEVDPARVESSLHGACANTHDRLTLVPGSFEKTINNIQLATKAGLKVILNCPLTCYNENEVDQMYALADRLGVTLKITPEISPRDDGDTGPLSLRASEAGIINMYRAAFQYQQTQVDRAAKLSQELPINVPEMAARKRKVQPRGSHRMCGTGSSSATIDPFGNVYPCVQYRRKVGNVHEQSFIEMWSDNNTLTEIRQLAVSAFDMAQDEGVSNFCLGTAALKTGDPLKIHADEKGASKALNIAIAELNV